LDGAKFPSAIGFSRFPMEFLFFEWKNPKNWIPAVFSDVFWIFPLKKRKFHDRTGKTREKSRPAVYGVSAMK